MVGSQRSGCGRAEGRWCRGTDPQSPTGVTGLSHCWCHRVGPGESERRREREAKIKIKVFYNPPPRQKMYAICNSLNLKQRKTQVFFSLIGHWHLQNGIDILLIIILLLL